MGSLKNLTEGQETNLELVQLQDGEIVLRPAGGEGEAFVSIRFSEQVQENFGEQLQHLGQVMVQAALAAIMEQQLARWQAQVVDEEPQHYS